MDNPDQDSHDAMDATNGNISDAPSSPLSEVPEDLDMEEKPEPSSPSSEAPARSPSPAEVMDTGRPTRKRKAPSLLSNEPEIKTPSSSKTNTPKRKSQPVRGNFSADFLLSNPNSKLAEMDIMKIFTNDRSWGELTREQQRHLLSMLPDPPTIDPVAEASPYTLPNYLKQYMKENPSFQADIRLFNEDLKAGRYDPVWLRDAQAASDKRARGVFDDWKERNREEFWGQKQKVDYNALAGESSTHDLPTLVRAGMIKVGDVWTLRRGKGLGKSQILVEKEAMVSAISEDNSLSFCFPPGQNKYPSASQEDVNVENVRGPHPLSDAMLKEDGRIVGVRGANAWKEFRCSRKNQDMGSLWDIRELYHSRLPRSYLD